MRTRKSLLLIVLLCVTVVGLALCQEKRAMKHRDKSAKGKNEPDYTDRMREEYSDEYYDRNSAVTSYHELLESLQAAYRNNRAIDNTRSMDVGFKTNQQSSQSSNLPKSYTKSSEEVGGVGKTRKAKNVTIGDGICQSIDIRNNVVFFSILKDCRVIEGFLQIVLIENNTEADFENVSFPELREITGYFLLYRVDGLKSLSKLFPNLEVIRGNILLTDYAFMIYEMKNLQEIGLTSLTKISRGGVRIEKNPALCFTNTVNWSLIVSAGDNFIKDNRNEPNCPHVKGCSQCPGGYCWTAQHCQKLERSGCHEQCIGECYGPSDSECFVCKNYRHEGRCIESCPPDLYAYLSRRCISKDECQKMNRLRRFSKAEDTQTWRPFNGSCLTQCPENFEDDIDEKNMTTCRVCKAQCRKISSGAIIRHISDAQSFRGITIVKGALEFQIRNGNPNIMNELADAFGLIEEITEYLKVTHSFPITSLSFFKKLKVIKGATLDINNASLVILDNPNLNSLFPPSQKITIENGRLFFHYNPKLCLFKIEEFGKMVNITNFTSLEVQPESNGDKVACNIVNINITVKERDADHVLLSWDSYKPPEGQQLLNYLLNYIETENENITYEANACGNNTWQIVDVGIPNSTVSKYNKYINNLKPYTKYAAYVKTFTAKNKDSSVAEFSRSPVGQSEIIFFRTKSAIPSMPTNVSSIAISDSEILLKWGPPIYPNGPIGYYMISGTIRLDDKNVIFYRDYCIDMLNDAEKEEMHEMTIKTSLIPNPSSCCKDADAKIATSKQFEIFCHENRTINYLSPGWKDYCVFNHYNTPDSKFYDLANNLSFSPTQDKQKMVTDASTSVSSSITTNRLDSEVFIYNVSARNTSYTLKKLRHYSLYTITIAACGVKIDGDTPMCSSIQYANTRTKKRPSADDIHNVNVHVTNDTIVEVTWESVKDPNAFTVSYTIEYTNLDVKDAKKSTECIPYTDREKKHNSHYIRNLSPGRYSLRMRSTSLAGDGDFTSVKYFSVGLSDNNQIILGIVLTLVAVFISVIAAVLCIRSQHKKRTQERLIASVNPDYTETKYVVDSWEVPRENVEILEELGLGNFGMVYRGYLDGTVQVAIKTISENASQREKNEFLNEASVMKNFSTCHIIKLLGVVSMGNPPFVIMELMENGDLKTYLRKIRDTQMVPNATRIMRMAAEIADGMAYLESKKFVHRDLAARNCMVSKDLVCKIGDFGMARDIYETDYYKIGKKGLLPIRWMAPENLSDGVFTSDSDVWSFGVVLYEILTLAEIPYQGFSNEEVLHHVLRKGKLHVPRNCPETIQKIMEKCFKWKPSERPTFMEIVSELEPFLGQDFCEKSFYHSDEGIEIRSQGIKKVYHNAAPIRFHWGHETARWVKDFEDNVTLLDQMKAGTSRGRIFKNGFQHFGNVTNFEDVPLDR